MKIRSINSVAIRPFGHQDRDAFYDQPANAMIGYKDGTTYVFHPSTGLVIKVKI